MKTTRGAQETLGKQFDVKSQAPRIMIFAFPRGCEQVEEEVPALRSRKVRATN